MAASIGFFAGWRQTGWTVIALFEGWGGVVPNCSALPCNPLPKALVWWKHPSWFPCRSAIWQSCCDLVVTFCPTLCGVALRRMTLSCSAWCVVVVCAAVYWSILRCTISFVLSCSAVVCWRWHCVVRNLSRLCQVELGRAVLCTVMCCTVMLW